MFPIVVVARQLSKEEAEERALRWRLIFWLVLLPFFWQVVDAVFYAYRDVNFPHWVRFVGQVGGAAVLSWLLVRYFRGLFFFIAMVSAICAVAGGVQWLWRITTS